MVPTNHGKLMALVCKMLLALVPSDGLKYKIWKFAEKQMTKYKFRKVSILQSSVQDRVI